MPSSASRTLPSHVMHFRVRMPPIAWPIVRSPIFVSAWDLTCLRSSRLAGITEARTSLSSDEEADDA